MNVPKFFLRTLVRRSNQCHLSAGQSYVGCRSIYVSLVPQSESSRQLRESKVPSFVSNSSSSKSSLPKDHAFRIKELPHGITENMLQNHFSRFGHVLGCNIVTDGEGCYADVFFAKKDGLVGVFNRGRLHSIGAYQVKKEDMEPLKSFEVMAERLAPSATFSLMREYFSSFGDNLLAIVKFNSSYGTRSCYASFASKEAMDRVLSARSHQIADSYFDVSRFFRKHLTLCVGALHPATTDQTLHAYFSRFGELTRAEVCLSLRYKRSRCYGFVTFDYQEGFDCAFEKRPHVIDGKEVELQKGAGQYTISVRQLPPYIVEKDVKDYFAQFGSLLDCEFHRDFKVASVTFSTEEGMNRALQHSPHVLQDTEFTVRHLSAIHPHSRTVVANGFRPGINRRILKTYFSIFGEVAECGITVSNNTAYVVFASAEDALTVCNTSAHFIAGERISVRPLV